jgi:magnesium-transporting ATPase (P-type)
MEASKLRSTTRKVINVMMIVMVVAGAIVFAVMSKTHADGEMLSRMFLIFFGIIITVQIIPGIMLLGVMLKEVFGSARKEAVKDAVRK